MKNGKKIILITLALVLVASTILAFTGPGLWAPIKKGENLSINLGRAGVSFTDSFRAGTVNIYRMGTNGLHPPQHFTITQPLLRVKFYDKDWKPITFVTGAVYVFFDLRPAEQAALRGNRLQIAYYDTWTATWKLCATQGINGGTRAVCRIRVFGTYALMFRDP